MEGKIIEFVNLLRRTGIPVSPGETLDALAAVALTGIERGALENTLRACLIKNSSHIPVFAKLFGHYFSRGQEPLRREGFLFLDIQGECGGRPGTGGPGKKRGPIGEMGEKVARLIKSSKEKEFKELAREASESLAPLGEKDIENLRELERRVKVYLEWNIAVDLLEKEDQEKARELLLHYEALFRLILEDFLLENFGDRAVEAIVRRENLNETDFIELNDNQVEIMKKILAKLGRKIAGRLSMRMEKAKRGSIDLRATLKKSMSTGGIPLFPGYRRRRYDRPELAVFCDISGSVARFSDFMLQVVYSMQKKFLKVRSFVFIDRVDEVTELMAGHEVAEVFKNLAKWTTSSKTTYSNYGAVWEDIETRLLTTLTPRTTLLVLGDARNNYYRDGSEYLKNITSCVKRVLWFNPEPMANWNREDSLIGLYGSHCRQVWECRNLEQLSRAVREIL